MPTITAPMRMGRVIERGFEELVFMGQFGSNPQEGRSCNQISSTTDEHGYTRIIERESVSIRVHPWLKILSTLSASSRSDRDASRSEKRLTSLPLLPSVKNSVEPIFFSQKLTKETKDVLRVPERGHSCPLNCPGVLARATPTGHAPMRSGRIIVLGL